MSDFAIDPDLAPTLRDDSINRRQAEPASLADFFGREKRLEDSGPRRLVHPNSIVADCQHHIAAGDHRVLASERFIKLKDGRLDNQPSAAGHGITRIHGEIYDNLIQ